MFFAFLSPIDGEAGSLLNRLLQTNLNPSAEAM